MKLFAFLITLVALSGARPQASYGAGSGAGGGFGFNAGIGGGHRNAGVGGVFGHRNGTVKRHIYVHVPPPPDPDEIGPHSSNTSNWRT